MNTSDDEDDSSLSSVETDVDLLLQDVIAKASNRDDTLEGQWTFLSQSRRGGEMTGNLKSGVFGDDLKVSYDSVNEILKDKMLAEVLHSLEQVRKKLNMQDSTPIDALAAFAGALPFELLHIMKKWLMDTDTVEGKEVTFDDLVEFLRCEIDKLNFCSNLWKAYGFKMTPTKDKKTQASYSLQARLGRP